MKKVILVFALLFAIACDSTNPSDSDGSKTTLTKANISGMWFLCQDGFTGETNIDGVVTGTYDIQENYSIDSTEVYLFGETTLRWFYPRYYDDCYAEEVVSYSVQSGKIICSWFEDHYDTVDSNGYFENWLLQETYLRNNEWIVVWREVGSNEDGEYDGLYTAVYKKYSKNLPNPNWPWQKCAAELSKRKLSSFEAFHERSRADD